MDPQSFHDSFLHCPLWRFHSSSRCFCGHSLRTGCSRSHKHIQPEHAVGVGTGAVYSLSDTCLVFQSRLLLCYELPAKRRVPELFAIKTDEPALRTRCVDAPHARHRGVPDYRPPDADRRPHAVHPYEDPNGLGSAFEGASHTGIILDFQAPICVSLLNVVYHQPTWRILA